VFESLGISRLSLVPNQPHIQWILGALFLEVKRPGHEDDHSPLSSAEVKNAQYAFMAGYSDKKKHRDDPTSHILYWNVRRKRDDSLSLSLFRSGLHDMFGTTDKISVT
jgi:hypothetical protein